MIDLTRNGGWLLTAWCGVAAFITGTMIAIYSAFTSIPFALVSVFLVVLPLLIGIAGSWTRSLVFSLAGAFGSGVVVLSELFEFGQDAVRGQAQGAFLLEPRGIVCFLINTVHLYLQLTKTYQLRNRQE